MKRNEKILVYAVTGFLMVILGVAVLFGNKDRTPRPDRADNTAGRGAVSLQDLLRERIEGTARQTEEEGGSGEGGEAGTDDPEAEGGKPAEDPAEVGEVPLVAQPPSPAEQVAALFGPSRRERDFRYVTVQQGDTFRGLVQKWCGSVQEYVGAAERLNETVESRPLTPGQELVLPWVEAEVLLEAWDARKQGQPVEIETPKGEEVRLYTVQQGDSIWAIAVREVGTNKAPGYIEKIKALNQQIANFDLLRVGQELRLPQ